MRRPARLERAGALTPRDRAWSTIRLFNGSAFSVAEIMALTAPRNSVATPDDAGTGLRADTIICYLQALEKAGYVRTITLSPEAPIRARRRELRTFLLIRDVGAHAPRIDKNGKPVTQGCGREQMWHAIRIHKVFSCRLLAQAASTEAHPVAHDEAKTYVRFLRLAGYVVERRTGTRAQEAQYAFVKSRDTGPRAPLVTREKNVIDGNTGEEFKL